MIKYFLIALLFYLSRYLILLTINPANPISVMEEDASYLVIGYR